jgi:hypothetical protein
MSTMDYILNVMNFKFCCCSIKGILGLVFYYRLGKKIIQDAPLWKDGWLLN